MKELLAGAGKACLNFPDAMYPTDGFSGQYSDMFIRALVFEKEERIVLVSAELPSVRPFSLTDALRDETARLAGTEMKYVWLSMVHALSAPHTPPEKETEKSALYMAALRQAVEEAVTRAIASLRPACFATGRGKSCLNVSRDIRSREGWWIGLGGSDKVDQTLHVIRVDGTDGQAIAALICHPVKSCVLENTVMDDGKRYAGSDLAGAACRIMEEKTSCPVLFYMGAGGETFPKRKGTYLETGPDGYFREVKNGDRAYGFLEELAQELAGDALAVYNSIALPDPDQSVCMSERKVTLPGKAVYSYETEKKPPVLSWTYPPAEDREMPYGVLRLGSTAILGVMPEVMMPTMEKIREQSPFRDTLLFAMTNGGMGYIATDREFERFEFAALRTPLGQGSDRIFERDVIKGLKEVF